MHGCGGGTNRVMKRVNMSWVALNTEAFAADNTNLNVHVVKHKVGQLQ